MERAFAPDRLAIVGDGSALRGSAARDAGAVLAALELDARLLRDHTPVAPTGVAVAARNADELEAALRALPAATAAIFLTATDPVRARTVQQHLARDGRRPVITEHDTLAIALAAMTLVTLQRGATAPFNARVVVTGAATLPMLVPLLMACGVGDISSWAAGDAPSFPLAPLIRGTHAVIDLIGSAGTIRPADDTVTPPVLTPHDPVAHLLALPGLLYTVHEQPGWGRDLVNSLDVHRACVHALTSLTPIDRMLPDLSDPDLTSRVAHAVAELTRPPRTR